MTIARLGPYDQHCLRVETAERPVHIGILAILERAPLRDAAGRLEIDAIKVYRD